MNNPALWAVTTAGAVDGVEFVEDGVDVGFDGAGERLS